ncbi:putative protein [Methanobacterium congolense]|uniref:Uncharacterized protein n=1 Tax=Methanobacterium congolense TaxID=118062 RepID=A0A1D3L195_9EURY|nr:putative protein [Methanobacterium congolense]
MLNKNFILLTILIFLLVSCASPAFAVQSTSSTQPVQVTINDAVAISATWNSGANNSAINLGSVLPDGSQNTYTGGTSGEQLFTYSSVMIDVYTKASGPLTGGSNSIALTNFRYMGGSVTTARAFTTNYYKIYDNWQKAPQGGSRVAPITLYLNVPLGTNPGSYQTTIYFSAVKHNAGTPTTP